MKELSLKEIQLCSLEILKDVHQFCVTNNIMYSVAYGTLIGAVRHKGFIPWDDDVDIIMPREHYERFCKEYSSSSFKLECSEENEDYYLAFARVYDEIYTTSETVIPWHKGTNGVWIDVFPVDYVSDNYEDFSSYKSLLQKLWWGTTWVRQAFYGFDIKRSYYFNLKLLFKKVLTMNGAIFPIVSSFFYRVSMRVVKNSSKHWSQIACLDGYEYNKVKDFEYTMLMPFEDTEIMVMNGYDNVLRNYYGDYMQLPPMEDRVGHSDGLTKFYWK